MAPATMTCERVPFFLALVRVEGSEDMARVVDIPHHVEELQQETAINPNLTVVIGSRSRCVCELCLLEGFDFTFPKLRSRAALSRGPGPNAWLTHPIWRPRRTTEYKSLVPATCQHCYTITLLFEDDT